MAITLDGSNGITTDIASKESATFNRDTTDGDLIILQKDNATVGSIGVTNSGTNLILDGASGKSGMEFAGGIVLPVQNGARAGNTVDLGNGTWRWKDAYLAGGVYLGGTGAANYLDDYEEGTWTPVTSQGSATTNYARYTKVGNLVTINCAILDVGNNTSTTGVSIGGLPFTSSSSQATMGSCMIRYYVNGSTGQVNPHISSNVTSMSLFQSFFGGGNWSVVTYDDMSVANWDAYITISYYV